MKRPVLLPKPFARSPESWPDWADRLVAYFEQQTDEDPHVEVPAGAMVFYEGSPASTPPEGWLWCNAQTVPRDAYPDLFAAIGTTFNTGGEAGTEFRLPGGATVISGVNVYRIIRS